MDSVSQLGITFTNDSALLLGKSTNKSTNKKESVPGQAIDIRCEDGWYSTTLKPPVSVDTSLDTDTLDTNQQTVVSMETILETMLWKLLVSLLQRVLHRGVTADSGANFGTNFGTNHAVLSRLAPLVGRTHHGHGAGRSAHPAQVFGAVRIQHRYLFDSYSGTADKGKATETA